MLGACLIYTFREEAIRALLDTTPGCIIGEIARGALVYTLLGGVIPVLISTAIEDTLVAEGIPIGQHHISRTRSQAALCEIICEVGSGVDHRTSGHTDANGDIIRMCEVVKGLLGRA